MSRVPLIAGNWKMHKTAKEARAFIEALDPLIAAVQRRVFIAAPFTAIEVCVAAATGTRIAIGAQNMHNQMEGAFTGEISSKMLKSCGVQFVILGHSERRQLFGENDAFIRSKMIAALEEGLTPILCVGEHLSDRETDRYEAHLQSQLQNCFQGLNPSLAAKVVIAYEPVWAIGTGKTASPEEAQAVHRYIRNWVEQCYGLDCAEKVCIIYGGSVKSDNIKSLMEQTDIDGVLVGGAALNVDSFARIVNY